MRSQAWRLIIWGQVCFYTGLLIAGIACALYPYPTHGYLFQAQELFQFFFSTLLIYSLHQLQLAYITKAQVVQVVRFTL